MTTLQELRANAFYAETAANQLPSSGTSSSNTSDLLNGTTLPGAWANESASTCQQEDSIMGSILQNASPYLYPFIVEYSLIAAAFLYIMWSTIGKRYSMVYEENCLSSVSCHQVPVDNLSTSSRSTSYQNFPALYSCLGSSKGLLASHVVPLQRQQCRTRPVALRCHIPASTSRTFN